MRGWRLALVAVVLAYTLHVSFTMLDGGVWKPHHVIGLAILLPSLCLWALAHHQLGTSYAVRPEAHRLVTRGLYSKIRNPIYLFGGLFIAGLFAFLGIRPLFLLFVALVPMQVVRIRREERVLDAAFGDAYRVYKRQTWL